MSLVQADSDVALDSGREVDLGLDVQLYTEKQGRVLLNAIVVDGALQQLACGKDSVSRTEKKKKEWGTEGLD